MYFIYLKLQLISSNIISILIFYFYSIFILINIFSIYNYFVPILYKNGMHEIKIENSSSYCSQFNNFAEADQFYEYWTNKFPIEVRKKFCNDLNL